MRQYLITILVIVVTAAVAFTLPVELLEWQDQKRLENSEIQAAEEVVLAAQMDMTLIEKIQLMQRSSTTALTMGQGKNYSRDSIIGKAKSELQKLVELEIVNLDGSDAVYSVEEILFLVDTEDGTKSMILWQVSVYAGEYDIELSMDDETGKILSIFQREIYTDKSSWTAASSDEYIVSEKYSGELESVAEKWGEYLGISLAEVYDTPNPTADVDKDMEREIEVLQKEGLSNEAATRKVYEAWGIYEEDRENWLYGVYEDEGGIAVYLFRKNGGNLVFSASFYV